MLGNVTIKQEMCGSYASLSSPDFAILIGFFGVPLGEPAPSILYTRSMPNKSEVHALQMAVLCLAKHYLL